MGSTYLAVKKGITAYPTRSSLKSAYKKEAFFAETVLAQQTETPEALARHIIIAQQGISGKQIADPNKMAIIEYQFRNRPEFLSKAKEFAQMGRMEYEHTVGGDPNYKGYTPRRSNVDPLANTPKPSRVSQAQAQRNIDTKVLPQFKKAAEKNVERIFEGSIAEKRGSIAEKREAEATKLKNEGLAATIGQRTQDSLTKKIERRADLMAERDFKKQKRDLTTLTAGTAAVSLVMKQGAKPTSRAAIMALPVLAEFTSTQREMIAGQYTFEQVKKEKNREIKPQKLMKGIVTAAGVIAAGERVTGVNRFAPAMSWKESGIETTTFVGVTPQRKSFGRTGINVSPIKEEGVASDVIKGTTNQTSFTTTILPKSVQYARGARQEFNIAQSDKQDNKTKTFLGGSSKKAIGAKVMESVWTVGEYSQKEPVKFFAIAAVTPFLFAGAGAAASAVGIGAAAQVGLLYGGSTAFSAYARSRDETASIQEIITGVGIDIGSLALFERGMASKPATRAIGATARGVKAGTGKVRKFITDRQVREYRLREVAPGKTETTVDLLPGASAGGKTKAATLRKGDRTALLTKERIIKTTRKKLENRPSPKTRRATRLQKVLLTSEADQPALIMNVAEKGVFNVKTGEFKKTGEYNLGKLGRPRQPTQKDIDFLTRPTEVKTTQQTEVSLVKGHARSKSRKVVLNEKLVLDKDFVVQVYTPQKGQLLPGEVGVGVTKTTQVGLSRRIMGEVKTEVVGTTRKVGLDTRPATKTKAQEVGAYAVKAKDRPSWAKKGGTPKSSEGDMLAKTAEGLISRKPLIRGKGEFVRSKVVSDKFNLKGSGEKEITRSKRVAKRERLPEPPLESTSRQPFKDWWKKDKPLLKEGKTRKPIREQVLEDPIGKMSQEEATFILNKGRSQKPRYTMTGYEEVITAPPKGRRPFGRRLIAMGEGLIVRPTPPSPMMRPIGGRQRVSSPITRSGVRTESRITTRPQSIISSITRTTPSITAVPAITSITRTRQEPVVRVEVVQDVTQRITPWVTTDLVPDSIFDRQTPPPIDTPDPTVPWKPPPPDPIIGFPILPGLPGISLFGGKSRGGKGRGKFRTQYTGDVVASFFGQTGKKPSALGAASGIIARPLAR